MLLARLADGALRDALSLMDQCLSRAEEITADVVSSAVGLAGRDYLYELSAAVRGGDAATALTVLDRLYAASCDMERLCVEMIDFYRNLMILKSVKNAEALVIAAASELQHMREEAACYELPAVLHCMDALQNTLERLRGGASRRVEMEMALMRLATPSLDVSNEALLRRIKALEDALRSGVAAPAPAPTASAPTPAPVREEVPAPVVPAAPPVPTDDNAPEEPFTRWNEVMDDLRQNCMPLFGVLLGSSAVVKGDKMIICTDNELFRGLVTQEEHKLKLQAAVRNVTGRQYRFGLRRTAPVQQEATDPLTAFLRESRERGVPVTEE